MGRFVSPDPSGLVYADPRNPQSLNLYAYVLNNPLIHIDPSGLDCVYFNASGSAIESIDPTNNDLGQPIAQQSSDCGLNGGNWVNGTTTKDLASYNPSNDTWQIASYDTNQQQLYWSESHASGAQSDGTLCAGNCSTANGYSSISYAFFGNQIANGNWYDALHWAAGQTTPVSSFEKWLIGDPEGRNWCGAGGTGVPSGGDDWSCMAHDYGYMRTGNTWPGDNLVPFSGNKQLQDINQTLCNNVSSSNVKNFFTYTSSAGCH